jgi:hypothetical protein
LLTYYQNEKERIMITYKTVDVQGIPIFYRESGPKEAPALLLLHGFPSSSHMFRNLIPLLADRFRVIAPDYPGFGNSGQPAMDQFPYTFDAITGVMDEFLSVVGLDTFFMYIQDSHSLPERDESASTPHALLPKLEQPRRGPRIGRVCIYAVVYSRIRPTMRKGTSLGRNQILPC